MLNVRRLAERYSRGVALRRRLPAEFGRAPLFVSPDAALRYWLPYTSSIDPGLLSIASRYLCPGDVTWDLGGNVGFFALAAAVKVGGAGRVVVLEPDTWLVELLKRTAGHAENRDKNIEILCAAASDESEIARLRIAERGRCTNSLDLTDVTPGTPAGGWRGSIPVATTTLDAMLSVFSAPQLVKVDVEGAEVRVLRGAGKLLHDVRPIIYCEVCGENSSLATELLRNAGYRLFDPHDDEIGCRVVETCCWNTLAVPEEKTEWVLSR